MRILKKILKVLGALLLLLALGVGAFLIYCSATFDKRLTFTDTPLPPIKASADVERGRYLVNGPAHCAQCHSSDDRAHPEKVVADIPLVGGLEFALGPIGSTWAANLTPDPDTGIGKLSDEQLARTLRTGVKHDGKLSVMMRLSAARLSDEDIAAVIAYLRSRPPVKHEVKAGSWKLMGKVMFTIANLKPRDLKGPDGVPAPAEPSVERGAYLAENVALCVGCHSKMNMKTFEPEGPKAGGGDPDPSHGSDSDMEFCTPNLTSHASGFCGRNDEGSFVARLKRGRAISSSIMPWENFQQMTDVDMKSIYRYLKSLPPVDHDPGPSYRKLGWKPDAIAAK